MKLNSSLERMSESDKDRISRVVHDGMYAMAIGLGHQLGIFKAFTRIRQPCTAEELSSHAHLKFRYVEEWLGCMVVGKFVNVEDDRFYLPVDPEWMEKQSFIASLLPIYGMKTSELIQCIRQDGPNGFAYDDDQGLISLIDEYKKEQVNSCWIKDHIDPVMTYLQGFSGTTIQVLDYGCGTGRLTVALAQRYPDMSIFGIDESQYSINRAEELESEYNSVSSNFKFLLTVDDALPQNWKGLFDLVIMDDVLHDMADPLRGVEEVKKVLKPDGLFLCYDSAVHSKHSENNEDAGFDYFCSLFSCLPCSLSREPFAGLGVGWGYENKIKFLKGAGFQLVSIDDEDYSTMRDMVVCRLKNQ